ncbi:hypothetical protein CBQ26_06215 [Deinococcus indicus]|uniref:Carbohydrate kinase n=1 Tax=Deinococcus indicus TaxID=223556 RepID=A0A246BQ88_9DEIO|nr:FGGY-family carbohydrate kinase [Deinococcus indicus]OWL97833.1 hypothetical protein CBQ26_06215 [Deinococcus indicus]GHG18346.1 gluconate kinase [Deinococcus indicus]
MPNPTHSPPSPPLVVAFDLGTTALKAVLFHGSAERHRLQFPYPLHAEQPGQATQRLPDLMQAFTLALGGMEEYLTRHDLTPQAAGFSSAMHTLTLIRPGGPSDVFTFADLRAGTGGHPVTHLHAQTGVPWHPMTPAVKLAALHTAGQLHDVERVSGVKEELLRRFFGVYWTDQSTASATGLLGRGGTYDPQALAQAGVTTGQLPAVHPIETPLPPLQPTYRARYPRLAAAHWAIGASDGVTATEGLGITRPDQAALSVGTSSAIRTFTPRPATDPHAHLFSYRADHSAQERYLTGGPSNNAGIVLNWLRDHLNVPHDLDDLLHATTPGARGLLFLPALSGERAPLWDPHVSGNLLGLGLHHTQGDIARAGMEGVALHLAWLSDLLASGTQPLREYRATGGLTRSRAWLRVLANALNAPVLIPDGADLFEGSAFGAARIAARSAGLDLPHTLTFDTVEPDTDAPLYATLGRKYRHAAHALQTLTHDLRAL